MGYHTHVGKPEVFVSHANVLLTPKGRLNLALLVVERG